MTFKLLTSIKSFLNEILDFQSRIWVVHIVEEAITDQSFVINEDGFKEPLEWMKKRGYSEDMLKRVDKMGISQVIELPMGEISYRLMRVK
ncbi:hypothetical protein H5300_20070 [Vibrio sp. SG41-7]|jgi:hypothetical protein|uniref:hypothetical protein n=1 Tax=Vibrio sp. SG41-7 TaxID=2760973 RepID=UPI0016010465|nr:hypothetical protein [Vibrio sp. SG41-7]MBB1465574.1 hypothetical protein [Vibrio sp. SG41-7]